MQKIIDSDCSERDVQAFLEHHASMVIAVAPVYDHRRVISKTSTAA